MHPYSLGLKSLFEEHADPVKAAGMSAYMRHQFAYLGIKSPEASALIKEYVAKNGLPRIEDLAQIAIELWNLPEREYVYAAIHLISKHEKRLPENFLETIEALLLTKSWWDSIDTLTRTVGIHFKRFPQQKEIWLTKWRKSENFWLRRMALLFQLHYKKGTDFELMKAIIRENLGSKEFFINKAIGWALRTYSRIDEQAVRTFVAETDLHPLSAREALKWLNNRNSVLN